MKKSSESFDIKVPLDVHLETCIEMGTLGAAINAGLLEDGYWTDSNEGERYKYLKLINESVTNYVKEILVDYGVDLTIKK